MKQAFLANIIAYFFILLFLYTGLTKLMDLSLFKEQLLSSPLIGGLAGPISWVLPIGEIVLVVLLFIPALQIKGLYAGLVLMALFTLYVVVLFFIDDHLACSCGGIIEELTPGQHILFNSACVVLCGVAILTKRQQEPTRQFKLVTGTSALGLFLVIGWALFSAFSAPVVERTGMEGRLLPAFDLQLYNGGRLNTADIPGGKPFVVIGFSPTCRHCGAETDNIVKNIAKLKDTRIYMVTPYPRRMVIGFYEHFHLAKYPNITVGLDSVSYFMKYFKAKGIPFSTVFDVQKRLKQVIPHETDAETLAKGVAD